jgi:spore germination protein
MWLIGLVFLITGCWDRVEIEERGFVIGSAIDSSDKTQKFILTFQFVIPSAMQGKDKGGKEGQTFLNISSEENTLFKATREISTLVSRSPYLEHNKIIIVSEKLARDGKIAEVLDFFIRDHEMRRSAKVIIAAGEARELLEIKPAIEKLPVQSINSASENPNKSESITPPTNIGDIHEFLLENTSFAIPQITALDNKVKVSGAAVFNGNDKQMRGFLNDDQTSGRNFFKGRVKAGAIEILVENKYVVFELKDARRKIQANVSDKEHPVFDIRVSVDGNVSESYTKAPLLRTDVISEIENKVEAKITDMMEEVLEKVQRDYKSDVLGLGDYLNEGHYSTWRTIRQDWDQGKNYFSKCRVNIHVNVKLKIIGSIVKTES